ncbi:F0F1 ATP synthase subunit delta [Clostridium vincentii]|uniref:ATP synthase subunit delta n=1 Tax=Clostridium vincentii TaxID=52704 RepID=A0A2T0BGY7_9CLOT|nr:F0F1 ATP synthase subunit delta [Clostridium vincentii]PRR83149.1 ATP synthase subunit delta, sodium ion specific [Clostridium vincentii]
MYEYLDKRYALALYRVAEEKGKVKEYLGDLRAICDLIDNNEDFKNVIKHPQISTKKKKQTFINIFKGSIDEELLSFLLILIEKDRIVYIREKLNEMEKIHLERENTLIAVVKTAVPMLEAEAETLKKKLEKKYDKKIIMTTEVDKDILGGVFVRVGNDVIDGTVKSRLDEMKDIMLKKESR